MKPHHAAALGLLSWFLIAPPFVPGTVPAWNSKAALSKWKIVHRFDKADDCTDALTKEHDRYEAMFEAGQLTMGSNEWKTRLDLETCIASDDPRLKEPSK